MVRGACSSSLNDKVALVVGGARGIGAAICEAFLDEGATVVIADRNVNPGRRAVGPRPTAPAGRRRV